MGREKDVATLAGQAQRARERGRTVFAAKLTTSVWKPPDHGEVEFFVECIEAVEAWGWQLEHWSVSADTGGATCAYPVFRLKRSVIQDVVGDRRL